MSQKEISQKKAYSPAHLLSKRSKAYNRNTFFWTLQNPRIIGGLNNNITPVTSKTLHNWANLLHDEGECPEFEFYPVDVKPYRIFNHTLARSGPNIPAMSTDLLPPGDYCYDLLSDGLFNPFKSKVSLQSFKLVKHETENADKYDDLLYTPQPELLHLYNVPEDIAKSVLKREQGRCIITGCADPDALTVAWLIPPLFVKHLYHVRGNREYTRYSEITKPGNAITLRKDLEDAFLDGAFGIDVDEDYRLVMFRDIGPAGHTLKGLNVKAYFRSPDVEAQRTGPEDIFLRAQLVNCIYVNFHGGDINAQWTPGMIREKEDELGLSPRSDFRRPRKNKRWEDELAQIVHELHYGRPFGDHDDNSDTEYDSEVYSDSERGGGGRNEGDSSSNESNLDK